MGVGADVAGAAGASAHVMQGGFHRLDHLRVLAHAQVVVGAPHDDRALAVVTGEAAGVRIRAAIAQDIDEDSITALLMQAINRLLKEFLVVHSLTPWDRYGWHNSYVPEGCAAIVEFVATSATVANRERFALALNAPAAAPVITQPAIPRPRAQRNAPRSPPRPPPPARPDSIWAS